jgi:flagellar biosynthesis chaperone FliJ
MSTYAIDKLLELRRRAENDAAIALGRASAAKTAAWEAQNALKRAAAAAGGRWEAQRNFVPGDKEFASDALARHHFVDRLATDAQGKGERARLHRTTVVEAAERAEEAARQAYVSARQDRQAAERHQEREVAAARTVAARREEDG